MVYVKYSYIIFSCERETETHKNAYKIIQNDLSLLLHSAYSLIYVTYLILSAKG